MAHRSLTILSISVELGKYFVIIPAVLAAMYPALYSLNPAPLTSPQSAVLSAVIFNALIVVPLLALAVRGVMARPGLATRLSHRNRWIYGLGGFILASICIELIDICLRALALA
jgi:K+-transporting ATPase ATPase B chain